MRAVYLHGFASSAHSTKATWLGDRFAARGVPLVTPDLNLPEFRTLTITRMLDQVAALVADGPPGPVVLIGSSLGGVVALYAASRMRGTDRPPDRLVLLAPAIAFGTETHRFLSPDRVREWRARGTIDIYHYGDNRLRPLDVGFYEDSQRYDARGLRVEVPTLVFQGRQDESVDAAAVEAWAAVRPWVTLHLLDDDHLLARSVPFIWERTAAFLGLVP